MNKSCLGRHPRKGEKQYDDITPALSSMLNCRRYLVSQGFNESFDADNLLDNNQMNNIGGYILFSDGSKLTSEAFIKIENSSERDALLERMIEKEITFKRKGIGDPFDYISGYQRDNVVRTSFSNGVYGFKLSVIDTRKEGIVWPMGMFMFSPGKFSFRYNMLLKKVVITDQDLEEFSKHRECLDDVMKQEKLLTYSSQVSQRKRTRQELDVSHPEIQIINPLEVDFPRIGGKKNE